MLTLLIDTYNNTNGLQNVLEKIAMQAAGRDQIRILIIDDASDCDIQDISAVVPESLRGQTDIRRNRYHLGYPAALTNMFTDCITKWCMPLNDRSELLEGALDTILSDVEQFNDDPFGLIQYNTFGIRENILDEYLFSDGLESFCTNMLALSEYGDAPMDDVQTMLTGFSNKVYNVNALSPFARYAYQHAGTFFPGYIAVLKALDCKNLLVLHHNLTLSTPQSLLEQIDIKTAVMGVTTLNSIDFKITREDKNRLIKCFAYNYMTVISDYISGGLTDSEYLENIYNSTYKYCLDEKGEAFVQKLVDLSKTGEDIMYLMDLLG